MKKLQLKKEVVARLDDDQMSQMRGGAHVPVMQTIMDKPYGVGEVCILPPYSNDCPQPTNECPIGCPSMGCDVPRDDKVF